MLRECKIHLPDHTWLFASDQCDQGSETAPGPIAGRGPSVRRHSVVSAGMPDAQSRMQWGRDRSRPDKSEQPVCIGRRRDE